MAHHANLIFYSKPNLPTATNTQSADVNVANTYYLPLESLMGFGVKWKTLLGRKHNHPKFFLSDK
jgi:hypothetical protein